jgi:hypothetical protein
MHLFTLSFNILGRKSGILNIFLYKISVLYYDGKIGILAVSQLQLPSFKKGRQGNCQTHLHVLFELTTLV